MTQEIVENLKKARELLGARGENWSLGNLKTNYRWDGEKWVCDEENQCYCSVGAVNRARHQDAYGPKSSDQSRISRAYDSKATPELEYLYRAAQQLFAPEIISEARENAESSRMAGDVVAWINDSTPDMTEVEWPCATEEIRAKVFKPVDQMFARAIEIAEEELKQ